MSGTIDTLTAARNPEAADPSETFEDIHRTFDVMDRKLDTMIRMSAANLAMTSVILGIVLARFFQP